MHHIKTDLYHRDNKKDKTTNFKLTLPATDMIKSEYNLEFLKINQDFKEREVGQSILNNL